MADVTRRIGLSLGADLCWPICYEAILRQLDLSLPIDGDIVRFDVDPVASFLPVRVECDEWGRHWAVPQPTHNSGDFTSLAGTDGFVELPPGPNVWPKGFVTRLYRW